MRIALGFLLTTVTSFFTTVSASLGSDPVFPIRNNVEISLTANWNETPFKLNVIEAISSLNSSLYEPLVLKLLNIEIDNDTGDAILLDADNENENLIISDSDFYNYALSLLSNDLDKSLADLYISNKIFSPRIEAHYNYYNNQIKSTHDCEQDSVFFDSFGEEFYCDQDAAFMLKTASYAMIFEDLKLPFDRLIGSSSVTSVIYTIYGDYNNKYFRLMFYNLYQFVLHGKFNLIWRHVSPSINSTFDNSLETLSGYGASLNLKRTDYIAIDDRGFNDNQQKNLNFNNSNSNSNLNTSDINYSNLFSTKFSNIEPVNESNIKLIGVKLTKFINDSKNKLSDLMNLISEFPKYANFISNLDYDSSDLKKILSVNDDSFKSYIPSGIYINNAVIPPQKTDIFEILKTIRREVSFTNLLSSFGFDYSTSQKLMEKFATNMLNLFHSPSRRYDLSKFSKTIVYLNDIEKDSKYSDFIDSKEAYKSQPAPGTLPNAKENIHEVIFVIDLTNPLQLSYLLNFYDQVFNQKIPIRIGVIPLLETSSKWNENAISKLFGTYHELGPKESFNYLSMLNRFVSSREPLTLLSFRALEFPYLDDSLKFRYTDNLENLYSTFSFKKDLPLVISNGIIFDFTEIDAALDNIFEDTVYLLGSLNNKKIPSNVKLSKFLRKNSIKIRNSSLIPDKISQFKNNFVDPPHSTAYKHWQHDYLYRIIKEPYRNEALVTINLLGSFLDDEYIKQVIEFLKYSAKAKGVKIVISDVHATTGFQELILLTSYEEQLNFLNNLSSTNINDDFQVRDTHRKIKDMFGIDYQFMSDINMIIAGRKILLKNLITSDVISAIVQFERSSRLTGLKSLYKTFEPKFELDNKFDQFELFSWITSVTYFFPSDEFYLEESLPRISLQNLPVENTIHSYSENELLDVQIIIDPVSEQAQEFISFIPLFNKIKNLSLHVHLRPNPSMTEIPIKRFYKSLINTSVFELNDNIVFENVPEKTLFNVGLTTPQRWMVAIQEATTDLDNLKLDLTNTYSAYGEFILKNILVEGYASYFENEDIRSPASLPVELISGDIKFDTNTMANFGYFQLKANPGIWNLQIKPYTKGSEIFNLPNPLKIGIVDLDGSVVRPIFEKNWGMESINLIEPINGDNDNENLISKFYLSVKGLINGFFNEENEQAEINIFTVASGHLYERFLGIMIASVMKQTTHSVKFWLIENYMSPDFKKRLPLLAEQFEFKYELIMYNWPIWLNSQRERQRTIWGYKILFLDVLFPQDLNKVIFVDSDQIIRTDLKELIDIDLEGAPYGYTPMCDSRKEMEGFRFWKKGYWERLLGDQFKYHISALYVVDLNRFRKIAAGDILRHQYQSLSYDPNSLSNLDQDLPNNLQRILPIYSLPQEWLWCETWCSDESLKDAKTIDLCNNPLTKEPKLDRARRQVKEWVDLDNEVSEIFAGKSNVDFSEIKHDEL